MNRFRKPAMGMYFSVVSLVIFTNIFLASKIVSSTPLVDGWSVWNQLMLLDFGGIEYIDYIFSYFGAHPHSVIKFLAWVDYRTAGGEQILTSVTSFCFIALFGYFLSIIFFFWARNNVKDSLFTLVVGAVIAMLATSLADNQVMTLPFQAVLSVSRLSYVLLLWLLLRGIERKSEILLTLLALIASIATTFHGSGIIFAAIWLAVCLVYSRRLHHMIISLLPLLVWFVQSYYYKIGGELDNVGSLSNKQAAIELLNAFLLYFATPLSPFYSDKNKFVFLLVGFFMAVFAVSLAFLGIFNLLKSRPKTFNDNTKIDDISYAGILCVFVILSGFAASLLATIRVGSLADSVVLTTPRYISYALLPYIFFVFFLAKISQYNRILKIVSISVVSLVGAISAYPTVMYENYYSYKLSLDRSIALISVGLSPLEKNSMFIWPNAKDDWYWVNALPRTISYMRANKIGPWHAMPLLGQSYVGKVSPSLVKDVVYSLIKSNSRCSLNSFEGKLDKDFPKRYMRNGVFPVLDGNGVVIGFSYQVTSSDPSKVAGFINNKINRKSDELFIGSRSGAYHDDLRAGEYSGDMTSHYAVPYHLTDGTWENGIAKNWPGFFVEDSQVNRELLSQGKVLRFVDGSYRTIDRQIIANGFVNIHTEGPLINVGNGFPAKIRIVDWCTESEPN